MSATVGTNAPDFTLPNQDRQPVTLSAAPGRTSCWRFSRRRSPRCVRRSSAISAISSSNFNSANATVYGISVDTPFTFKEFAKQNALTFDLLSDFNKDAITKFDVVNPDMLGLKGISRARGVRHRRQRRHPTPRSDGQPRRRAELPESPRSTGCALDRFGRVGSGGPGLNPVVGSAWPNAQPASLTARPNRPNLTQYMPTDRCSYIMNCSYIHGCQP